MVGQLCVVHLGTTNNNDRKDKAKLYKLKLIDY